MIKQYLLSFQNIVCILLCFYVIKLRYDSISTSETKQEDVLNTIIGSTSSSSIVLSSLSGFVFAMVFFIVRTKMTQTPKNFGKVIPESVLPIVIAATMYTMSEQYILMKYPHPRFEFGFVSGIIIGSAVASKLL